MSYTAVGQTIVNGQTASNAASPSRDWNRVYRSAGNFFDLAYLDGNGSFQSTVHSNAGNSPFVEETGNAFLARAWCRNSSGGTVTSVTCQTTAP